jgi:NAD(P)H-hydrate epimerase
LHAPLAGRFAEATWVLLPEEEGAISEYAAEVLWENLGRATALLIGPGFGLKAPTGKFISRLLKGERTTRPEMGLIPSARSMPQAERSLPPLVFDADGLKLLAQLPEWFRLIPAPAVLTPHPGEMSVLSGLNTKEIQANRLEVAERYAREWGHVVVLKGAFTVVAAPDGQTAVIPVASPALARAGSGDVLAGLIVGLRAQGVDAFPAAVAGAWIHAQAGLSAARSLGSTASVLAGDILKEVIEVMRALGT